MTDQSVDYAKTIQPSWDAYHMGSAQHASTKSKDPSTKCGAVIVDKKQRQVSAGFNGFPRGTSDDPALYTDRARKLRRVLHAEKNAILFARQGLEGCTIYIWPFPPCAQCAAAIIQVGITRVVCPAPSPELAERWRDDLEETRVMLDEAGVILEEIP